MGAGAHPIKCSVCGIALLYHIQENKWLICMGTLMRKLDGSLDDRLDKRIKEVKNVVELTEDCLTNKEFQYKDEAKKSNAYWSGVLEELLKLKSDN